MGDMSNASEALVIMPMTAEERDMIRTNNEMMRMILMKDGDIVGSPTLDAKAAAKFLDISVSTLMKIKGQIGFTKGVGKTGQIKFVIGDLKAYQESRKQHGILIDA